jgi:hypothetical protein
VQISSSRQGSFARRVAISTFALYALLFQAFLVASVQAPAFSFPGGISDVDCTLAATGAGLPGNHPVRNHGLCCVLACAAAACAYVGPAAAVVAFSARFASTIDFAPLAGLAARPPIKYYFAARGPPEDL